MRLMVWVVASASLMLSRAMLSAPAAALAGGARARATLVRRSLALAASASSASPSPALDAVRMVKSGERTAESLVLHSLEKIASEDGVVGAFLSVQGEDALAAARAIDDRVRSGDSSVQSLPLAGLPIAVKDNLCIAGVPTTAGSKMLAGYLPSYDATAVERLRAAGAILIGKTNMDEFGMGSSTENSAYQITRNPRALDRSPGGSSGGSAAAIASGAVLAALGTDTGGSIRQPASWCGVVGLKPTYGRVSRRGLIAYASSTDCVGPLATTVTDCAALVSVMMGADREGDATSRDVDVPLQEEDLLGSLEMLAAQKSSEPLAGIRVGVIKEAFMPGSVQEDVGSAVKLALAVMSDLGAEIVDISLSQLPQQCAAYYVNVLSEASANLARFDGIRYGYRPPSADTTAKVMSGGRHEGFGDEVRRRILLGTFSLSAGYSDAYYKKAQDIRRQLREDFDSAFKRADVFICPTAPTTAYALGEYAAKGVASYADDLFTVPASLAGLPAISVPCGVSSDGLPIGLQVIGPAFGELSVLSVARAFEQQTAGTTSD